MKNAIAVATGLLFFSATTVFGETDSGRPSTTPSVGPDETAVYEAVLTSWLGKGNRQQLVDEQLGPAPSKNDSNLRECSRGLQFSPDIAAMQGPKSLAGVQFKRNGIKLMDGSQWQPTDPGQGIANGKSVESAVREGFSKSLISFSQILFSRDRKDALVKFSMVCGSLCGSGATIRLHKSATGWAVERRCEDWVS